MALRGLSGVSLREINEAAGLRNVSAAHYHFGSREGVVAAILSHRVPAIQERRKAFVNALGADGKAAELRELVGALVWPLVEEIRPRAEGSHYLRFLEQIRRERPDSPMLNLEEITLTWPPITAQLRAELNHLPTPIAEVRLRLEYAHMVAGLASIETWIEQGELSAADLDLAAEVLIDGVAHAISGPASRATLRRMRSLDHPTP